MPIVQIDITKVAVSVEAKRKLVAKVTKAVDEAYPLPGKLRKPSSRPIKLFPTMLCYFYVNMISQTWAQTDGRNLITSSEHPRKWCLRLRGREAGLDDKKFGFDEGVPARRNT